MMAQKHASQRREHPWRSVMVMDAGAQADGIIRIDNTLYCIDNHGDVCRTTIRVRSSENDHNRLHFSGSTSRECVDYAQGRSSCSLAASSTSSTKRALPCPHFCVPEHSRQLFDHFFFHTFSSTGQSLQWLGEDRGLS